MSDFYGMIRSLETRGGIFESYKEIVEFRELLLDCNRDEIGERIKRLSRLPGMSLCFSASSDPYVNRSWRSTNYASPVYAVLTKFHSGLVEENLSSMSEAWLRAAIPQLDLVSAPIPLWAATNAPPEFTASGNNRMSFENPDTNMSKLIGSKIERLRSSAYSYHFQACASPDEGRSLNSSFSDVIRTVGTMVSFLRGDKVYFRSGDHMDDELKRLRLSSFADLAEAQMYDGLMIKLRAPVRLIFEWCGLDRFLIARAADQHAWINRTLRFVPWLLCPNGQMNASANHAPVSSFPDVSAGSVHQLLSSFIKTRDWTHYENLISGKYPQG